jgi:hypothetical protein
LTYSLAKGNDEVLFNIEAISSDVQDLDFESKADGTILTMLYVINVIANDGLNTASQTVTITMDVEAAHEKTHKISPRQSFFVTVGDGLINN